MCNVPTAKFTQEFCLNLAEWPQGFLFRLLVMDHLDDPPDFVARPHLPSHHLKTTQRRHGQDAY
jgi:hypothetical protein